MIHYHGTPCGGTRQDTARFLAGRHCLIPFPRPDDLPAAAELCQSFCIDNGAFSIWKNGGTLDVLAYAEFCREWCRHPAFDWCLIPDVIDGDWKTNYQMIVDWTTQHGHGIPSVPVWHYHEPLDLLTNYSMRFRTVALGSSGDWPTPGTESWWKRTDEVMKAVCDEHGRPRCKLHGLRMLSPEIFTRLPLASADSTNAVRNASNLSRFGSYPPPTSGARMVAIADRIESFQSAACWKENEQKELWQLGS